MRHNDRIEKEVAKLGDLPYADLTDLWMRAHGCRPPRGIKRRLLERSAAFELQTKAFGGLPATARKALRTAMRLVEAKRHRRETGAESAARDGHASAIELDQFKRTGTPECGAGSPAEQHALISTSSVIKRPAAERVPLLTGSRLLREWNGRQHFVDVGEDAFTFDGKSYRSLSAIAKKITGAQWSGPRFFGL